LPKGCEGAAPVAEALGSKDDETPPCYPPADFVERLCKAIYPSVPLVMFRKGSPWRRGYLRGETKAWTTAPGGQNEKLAQDEEVLVLQEDASRGDSVQYESGAAFYALRWDGTCVKLTEQELMQYVPWGKNTPVVQWQLLDDVQQAALREDPKIDAAYLSSRKQCRSSGAADAACKRLERRLSDLVVAHVRDGAELPDPAFRP
jgi:hypothetical protein